MSHKDAGGNDRYEQARRDLPTAPSRGTLARAVRGRSFERGAGWLSLSVAAVGVVNCAYSMILVWLLPAPVYSSFAGGQSLLLSCVTVANASVPWAIAHGIAQAPLDAHARRRHLSFGIRLACGQGLLAAVVSFFIASRVAVGPARLILALGAMSFFVAATGIGYLQGLERFRAIAALRIGEVVVKVGVGVLLVVGTGAGAAGALAGFGAGAVFVIAGGAMLMGGDLRPSPATPPYRSPWRHAGSLALIQAGCAALGNADILLASIALPPGSSLASYQVSAIVGRAPLFLAAAIAVATFPRMSAPECEPRMVLRSACELYFKTVVPVAIVLATTSRVVVELVFPVGYAGVATLLPWTVASGAAIGLLQLIITAYQAEQRFPEGGRLLSAGLAAHSTAITVSLLVGGIRSLAVGTAVGSMLALAGALWASRRRWPGVLRPSRAAIVGAVATGSLAILRGSLLPWCLVAAIVMLRAAWTMVRPPRLEDAKALAQCVDRG